jgi:hypothetical protein
MKSQSVTLSGVGVSMDVMLPGSVKSVVDHEHPGIKLGTDLVEQSGGFYKLYSNYGKGCSSVACLLSDSHRLAHGPLSVSVCKYDNHCHAMLGNEFICIKGEKCCNNVNVNHYQSCARLGVADVSAVRCANGAHYGGAASDLGATYTEGSCMCRSDADCANSDHICNPELGSCCDPQEAGCTCN